MRLLPRSLFGRLSLLLVAVVMLTVLTSIVLFRVDRTNLLSRQLSETKIVQLQAIRSALAGIDGPQRRDTLERLSREYGVRIIPQAERPMMGQGPAGPMMHELASRMRERLGPDTDIRFAPRMQMLLVRVVAADTPYWVGIPVPPRLPDEAMSTRTLTWTLIVGMLLLAAAFAFARYLARPLRELTAAVARVGRGETAPALPEAGPSEIASVNRAFNAMTESLRQTERDRALLLAGVSHDLRTPLARLRLGLELEPRDEETRAGMVADIEEMDRIIGQFLDFARGDAASGFESADLVAIVATCVERYAKAGHPVRFTAGRPCILQLKPTAMSRLCVNLIDNALAYGAPPVDVTLAAAEGRIVLDVADRGAGVAPEDVERLKQPFTRANEARARADGGAGAGLGLAIVERIARLHGGDFDLLPRDGGGTVARVRLPMPAPA